MQKEKKNKMQEYIFVWVLFVKKEKYLLVSWNVAKKELKLNECLWEQYVYK